jgi:hypothetical protein
MLARIAKRTGLRPDVVSRRHQLTPRLSGRASRATLRDDTCPAAAGHRIDTVALECSCEV